jgi:hypothetical protein
MDEGIERWLSKLNHFYLTVSYGEGVISIGIAMTKQMNTGYLLAEIESNIETKEQQIDRLKTEFVSLAVDSGTKEQPKLILRQLSTLQDNVHRLKVRRRFLQDITR